MLRAEARRSIKRIGAGALRQVRARAVIAMEEVVDHPAVVAILVLFAGFGVGHHVHEVVPVGLTQTRVVQLVFERQRLF